MPGRETVDILCLYPADDWDDPVLGALQEAHGERLHHPASGGGEVERRE